MPQKQQQKAKAPKKLQKGGVPKGAASALGSLIGSMFGPAGTMVGGAAGNFLGKITGVGDYKVKNNSITDTGQSLSGEVPNFGPANNSVRIRHREFVGNIAVPSTPSAFTNTTYVLNPANASLFPWLAKIAENFQQYKLCGAVLVFKTTTSDYAASGALGKIAMATNYNVLDSPYANMVEMENSEFAVSGKPSMSKIHPIECASNNGPPLVRWVRDTNYDSSATSDARLYDVGTFQIATEGMPGSAGQILGGLWISYDIEFYKPIVGREGEVGPQYRQVTVPTSLVEQGVDGPNLELEIRETSYSDFSASSPDPERRAALFSGGSFLRGIFEPRLTFSSSRGYYSGASQSDAALAGAKPASQWPAQWFSGDVLRIQKNGTWTIRFKFDSQRSSGNIFTQDNNTFVVVTTQGAATIPGGVNQLDVGAVPMGYSVSLPTGTLFGGDAVAAVTLTVRNIVGTADYVTVAFNFNYLLSPSLENPTFSRSLMDITWNNIENRNYYELV